MKVSFKIMGEQEYQETAPFDRTVQQAILVIKKGAHLLKCGKRGKPKFCPFRLSMDEKCLVWLSGQKEKQLRLSFVTKIVRGQKTANFERQHQPDREEQSFSLISANTDQTLDLICKDKAQADSWVVGLRAVILKWRRLKNFNDFRSSRGVQSCVSSPAGFFRRKKNLGLMEDSVNFSKIRSLCASPSPSLHERRLSNGLSCSSSNFCSSESSLSQTCSDLDVLNPNTPYYNIENVESWEPDSSGAGFLKESFQSFSLAHGHNYQQMQKSGVLKDIMIWGEGVLGGAIGGVNDQSSNQTETQNDALIPKLLESTVMFDVANVSLGANHAALVTRQGEVFCWGAGNGGRLGHQVNMDTNQPKFVESLNGVIVSSVACSEYQTCAVSESGDLYTWGGHHIGDSTGDVKSRCYLFPHKISDSFSGLSVSKVACGQWHVAIISTSGQLLTYGDGNFGVLGHGNTQNILKPKEVEFFKGFRVKSVSCGPWHTAAVAEALADCRKCDDNIGKLFTWGDGDRGKLGHTDVERKCVPTCVSKLIDHDFIQVSCGWTMTVALTKTGTVYTIGSSMHGQLGNPRAKDKCITAVSGSLQGEIVKEISSGSFHIAVLTYMGNVYTWGKGSNGQLGLGDTQDRSSPCFVEALRDRFVESLACGSNLTAVISLHKGVSPSDQSTCSRCKLPFGFTRKRHNCYNCGRLFCHACSGKKAANASLAPNKAKQCRVCDRCFDLLDKYSGSNRSLKLESRSPRLLPVTPKRNDDDVKRDGRDSTFSYHPSETISRQKARVKEPDLVSDKGTRRWGRVSSPVLFPFGKDSFESFSHPKSHQSTSSSLRSRVDVSQRSKCSSHVVSSVEKSLSESHKLLMKEVERLRHEVRNLENQCELRNQKIQECQRRLDETWLLAKDEAAKCKAAKDVIKALASRLHTMKDRVCTNTELTNGTTAGDSSLPYLSPIATHPHPESRSATEGRGNSQCKSPVVFSDSLKSLRVRKTCQESNRLPEALTRQDGENVSKTEWVEQYEPGVYITLTTLAGGQKGLKRVRFSRRRFTDKEAQKWWEEKQSVVCKTYDIQGYSMSA